MRKFAKNDPAWLDDLAAAEATGFVHTAEPDAVDNQIRRLQFVVPVASKPARGRR